MITRIEVDGFKSLKEFRLDLKKGLNILVGPNGVGKTNIILFFEFLANLVSKQSVGTAVSQTGGAGAIFQKLGSENYVDRISCKIFGCYEEDSNKFFVYQYGFTINISFEKDDVFYFNQEVRMRASNVFCDTFESNENNDKWDLDISCQYQTDSKPQIKIKKFDEKKIKSHYVSTKSPSKGAKRYSNIIKIINDQNPLQTSIVNILIPITSGWSFPIIRDLIGGETFNIVPSKVRELEDAATPSGIKKDGSGLATTLYAMKKEKGKRERALGLLFFFDGRRELAYNAETLSKIIDFLKLANKTIESLDVDNDAFNNKLMVKIHICSGDYQATLPLSSMSDGTIKWISLITAILTSETIFSIEEPENFLHPWMQAEIVEIMRSHIDEKTTSSFVLMTTHSESLLNHAKPEEIILVDLLGGKTIARRLSNLKEIKEEFSQTGFGLGYFYFSNSLSYD